MIRLALIAAGSLILALVLMWSALRTAEAIAKIQHGNVTTLDLND